MPAGRAAHASAQYNTAPLVICVQQNYRPQQSKECSVRRACVHFVQRAAGSALPGEVHAQTAPLVIENCEPVPADRGVHRETCLPASCRHASSSTFSGQFGRHGRARQVLARTPRPLMLYGYSMFAAGCAKRSSEPSKSAERFTARDWASGRKQISTRPRRFASSWACRPEPSHVAKLCKAACMQFEFIISAAAGNGGNQCAFCLKESCHIPH